MRVVVGSWHSFELSCRDKFTHQDACTSLDTLSSIVGELQRLFIELDTVTEDTEHGTRTHDIGVKTFLLEVSTERIEK